MEHIRRYLDDESISYPLDDSTGTASALIAGDEEGIIKDEEINETRSYLGSTRIDGRSSDTKSIGSLSQHLFESDDNEDEKYFGTCNGYSSHPGSKSNLLLCSECDLRSKTCTYRPQTPSHYGRFVEERIDRDTKRHQQDRRSSTIPSILKSPMKLEGSPRYCKDDCSDNRERRSKSIPSTCVIGSGRHLEQDKGRQESRSPCSAYKSPVRGGERSPRYHDVDQRSWVRRAERDDEGQEGKGKRSQDRHHDARSPVQISDHHSPKYHDVDLRSWTTRKDHERDEEVSEDPDYLEESESSPPCPLCNGSNGLSQRCAHCNLSSDQDDGDLICFRCQMSAEEETTSVEGSVCPKCESNYVSRLGTNDSCQTTSSSSEGAKYPVDAVVKIQVNNRSIDIDSDDTIDSDPSNNRDSGDANVDSVDRLATIVEAKNDTASENGEENGSKINGQPRTKYLNYMIVLLL